MPSAVVMEEADLVRVAASGVGVCVVSVVIFERCYYVLFVKDYINWSV